MRKKHLRNSYLFLFILFISVGLFSCSSTKKVKYFQDIPDSGQLKPISGTAYVEPKIQTGDIVTVLIQTIDPTATANINLGNIPTPASSSALGVPNLNQQIATGYQVQNDGCIELSMLGKIKLAGYTTTEAKDLIQTEALKYLKDPTVTVRFANFRVNIAGEVLRPGVYVMPSEKTNLLEALTAAGDITIFGKRDNVLLIRENSDGSKTPYRINLKKSNIMDQPYYYLKQNDYIYVQPDKSKAAATDGAQARNITLIASFLSVVVVLLTRLK